MEKNVHDISMQISTLGYIPQTIASLHLLISECVDVPIKNFICR